ncbi:peptidylprolyl isomerase [Sorangium sp. So ce269]
MYAGSRCAPPHGTRNREEARALAEQALREAQQGVKLADLVARYSDEPGAGTRGGDLGKFPKGAMVSEFEQALEKVAVGALSGVVETPFGFHVILRTQEGSRADLIRVDQRARGDAESSIPDRLLSPDRRRPRARAVPRAQRPARVAVGGREHPAAVQ